MFCFVWLAINAITVNCKMWVSETGKSHAPCSTRAADRTRTDDLVLTKDVLYQLSYSSCYCWCRYGRPPSRWFPLLMLLISQSPELTNTKLCSDSCASQLRSLSFNGLLVMSERVKGIEPSSSAWKAVALPLSYTRKGRNVR